MNHFINPSYLFTFLVCTCFSCGAEIDVLKGSGGSIKTTLGMGVELNKNSSLEREWITIVDNRMPAVLVDLTGVTTDYESGVRSSGKFIYSASYEAKCSEPISAIEVRFIIFDVWGKTLKTLVSEDIKDMSATSHSFSSEWNLFSENEASSYYASIAYISRVRTKDGRVLEADISAVMEQAKRFNEKFEASELEPEERPKK